jgi:hypothetical protein
MGVIDRLSQGASGKSRFDGERELAMMTLKPRIRQWSFLAAALALLSAAGPPKHQFVTIDFPGATATFALGISNQGLVTGQYYDAIGNGHGFVYLGGAKMTVDGPTSNPALSQAALYNINNQGWVGAQYLADDGAYRAAGYNVDTQAWKTLPLIPGQGYSAAGGVNAGGVYAGNWSVDITASTGNQGWTFDSKTNSYSFFNAPGADASQGGTIVNGINNPGVVVGVFFDSQGVLHGFSKSGNAFRTIDVPGAQGTALQGVNNEGDVSGVYLDANGVRHGFVLLHNGKLINVDYPGDSNSALFGISANGNVAGYYKTPDGVFHGYYVLKAAH